MEILGDNEKGRTAEYKHSKIINFCVTILLDQLLEVVLPVEPIAAGAVAASK